MLLSPMSALKRIADYKSDIAPCPCRARSRHGSSRVEPPLDADTGLHLLKVRQRPGPIEVSFSRLVEPEIRKPVFARNGRYPVLFKTGRRYGPATDVHRTVRVLAQVHARRAIGNLLLVQDQCARIDVIERDRPEQLDRRIGGNAQAIRSAAIQPLPGLVLVCARSSRRLD